MIRPSSDYPCPPRRRYEQWTVQHPIHLQSCLWKHPPVSSSPVPGLSGPTHQASRSRSGPTPPSTLPVPSSGSPDPSVPGTSSPSLSLDSKSYEELVSRYCFVRIPSHQPFHHNRQCDDSNLDFNSKQTQASAQVL